MTDLANKYLQSVLVTGGKIKSLEYARLGIWEELGEVAGKVKRFRRGDYNKEEFRSNMKKSLEILLGTLHYIIT